MKKNYDFSNAVKNPYAKKLKKQLTIRLDTDTISYFQETARELGLPYQTLINMYLRDCAQTRRKPQWTGPDEAKSPRNLRSVPGSAAGRAGNARG